MAFLIFGVNPTFLVAHLADYCVYEAFLSLLPRALALLTVTSEPYNYMLFGFLSRKGF